MSAECDDCGADLVGWGEEMTCARCDMKAERDTLLSALKEWRQATESRLRLTDSRGEAAKAMLKPDADLIAVLEQVEGGEHG